MAFPPKGIEDTKLSALELMMEHADQQQTHTVGAPKPKKRRQKVDNRSIKDVLVQDFGYSPDEFEEYEEYVGPGSRKKNRELREARNQAKEQVRAVQQDTVSAKPDSKAIENALENVFASNEESGDKIVDALHTNNKVSSETTKVLQEWMDWEKRRAFHEDNKIKRDDSAPVPSINEPKSNGSDGDDGGDGLPDRERNRYGRDRNGKRRRDRARPKSKAKTRTKLRGKLGAILGGAAALATFGGAMWLANDTKKESMDLAPEDGAVPETPSAVEQPVARAKPETEAKPEAKTEQPLISKDAKDASVGLAVAGGMLLAGAKRLPLLGTAVQVGAAGYDANEIANDTTLTDQEKKKEYIKTASSAGTAATGATAGGIIGGTLGSVVPVLGTAAGAALGSVLGGLLGDYFGNSVGEYVASKITDETDATLEESEVRRQKLMDEYDKQTQDSLKENQGMPSINPFKMFGAGPVMNQGGGGYGNYGQPYQLPKAVPNMTSAQSDAIAAKAIAQGGLGAVSSQFESGGRGVSTVSSGQGDYGGVSYGKHQLATNNGSMMNFMQSKEGQKFADEFKGLTPGSAEFSAKYRDVASRKGEDLDKAQQDYITRTHYAPLAAKTQQDLGTDLTKRGKAVQEMLYSTSVQYGGGTGAISRALAGKDIDSMTDPEIVQAVQDSKAANVDKDFKSSDANTRASVLARTKNEKDVLMKVHAAEEAKKQQAKAVNTEKESVAPTQMTAQDKRIAEKFPDLPKGGTIDYSKVKSNTDVPDFTAKGAVVQKGTKEEYDAKLNEIAPVPKPTAEVPRQEYQAPEVIQAPAPAEASSGKTASNSKKAKGSMQSSSPSQSSQGRAPSMPSLDTMPMFLDDPLMNMLNLGYV
ncbi:hypothetical protein fHeYen902_018c [Yersinia phage fHe-Yen9-02]|nr:hypothetical protein fHeYen902_018c [Yersinia phage fHe-Yen9-02]